MLAGFIYVASQYVRTPYWLKLDCDVVADGRDDWIDPIWFEADPAIVAHRWAFTKPPNQMDLLDAWVEKEKDKPIVAMLAKRPPLNLHPESLESERLSHKRIISWCGFFQTGFTRVCAAMATETCPLLNMPVPSQDGFCWYVAQRLGFPIVRTNLKRMGGWQHWSTMSNVIEHSRRAMEN